MAIRRAKRLHGLDYLVTLLFGLNIILSPTSKEFNPISCNFGSSTEYSEQTNAEPNDSTAFCVLRVLHLMSPADFELE